ncbi:hypothetical protein GQ457_12G004930 [Hibiscus cannabinus]
MEAGLVLLGGGGVSGGGSSRFPTNESAVAKVEVVSEVSSYPVETELELGLSLGGPTGKAKAIPGRILTAKDFNSVVVPHRASINGGPPPSVAVSGTKRAADDGGSPTAISQVVGWPPIRAYRMNTLVNQDKAPGAEENKGTNEANNPKKAGSTLKQSDEKSGHIGYIKVNMDSIGAEKEQLTMASKLFDGSSEFVLTYEDNEGDWMLVGDVPWVMFLTSVRRLRIMKTSEANGLAPRLHERNERQRSKPI